MTRKKFFIYHTNKNKSVHFRLCTSEVHEQGLVGGEGFGVLRRALLLLFLELVTCLVVGIWDRAVLGHPRSRPSPSHYF